MQKAMIGLFIVIATLVLAGGGAYLAMRSGLISINSPEKTTKQIEGKCEHTLETEKCPFCTPALVESMGFCNGHGVPEAFCHLCNDWVIPAFKAKGDWCKEHDSPESLCPVCAPGAGLKYKKGAEPETVKNTKNDDSQCAHTLQTDKCPWCTPKLMVDLGFCKGHNTPEAFCAPCDPSIIPALKKMGDWCAEHNQSETFCDKCNPAKSGDEKKGKCPHTIDASACPWCTPKLIVSKGFCKGHNIPEAFCHLCDPGVIPAFKARGDWCAEHNAPESFCQECSPTVEKQEKPKSEKGVLIPGTSPIQIVKAAKVPAEYSGWATICETEKLQVRLAPGIADKIGIETTRALERPHRESNTHIAQIDYDHNRLAKISARAPGVVSKIHGKIGGQVKEGETLAVIDSAAIGNARAELLQVAVLLQARQKNFDREQKLVKSGISTEKDSLEVQTTLTEAKIAVSRAKQALRNFGFTAEAIEKSLQTQDTSSKLNIVAPFNGILIQRNFALGEVIDTSKALFEIADVSKVWAKIDIYETDFQSVREGMSVLFASNAEPGERYTGKVIWTGTEIDPQTRTLQTIAELDNSSGKLRVNMFGKAEVYGPIGETAMFIPKQAVQWDGCCHIVFAQKSEMFYQPVKVKLGSEHDNHYQVVAGLEADQLVVTAGSFLLKTEIMKGSIGAGCCETNSGEKR